MKVTESKTVESEALIPWFVLGPTAILCAVVLAALALLGPLWLGDIEYRASQSGIWQIEGADIVNLVLIAPILLIGGALHLMRKSSSRYFLILAPITLMYTGLTLGIAQEWSNPDYSGNSEQYAWLFLVLVIGGLVLLIGTLPLFTAKDVPEFKLRGLRIYVIVMSLFLLVFAVMWISEMASVVTTGDTASGSYSAAPGTFWTVRFLDLGITIPLGFIALALLLTKPERTYSLVLLFFGFFVTLGSAVLSMGVVMTVNDDPEAQARALPIFGVLALLSYAGLVYLVKDKLKAAFGRTAPGGD
ncbi:MAG TPA: hypothetical protein VF374_00480 [Thermoplasmata archaeon]|jgi:hypothetical protein